MKLIILCLLLNGCVFKAAFQAKSEKAFGPKAVSFTWHDYKASHPINLNTNIENETSIDEQCLETSSCLLKLEKEFWVHISSANLSGIKSWIDKVEDASDGIRNNYHRSRVKMLLAFAYVQWSRRTDVYMAGFDLLKAQIASNEASKYLSHSFNNEALSSFIYLFEAYAISYLPGAEKELNYMNTLGTEGPDTAAFALLYTNDEQMVEKGIALIEDCPEICSKTTTLAPYKELVNRLVVLEAYAFLLSRKNRTDLDYLHSKMRTQFGEFKSLAIKINWPYLKDLDHLEDSLLNPNSKYNFELKEDDSIGYVRLPLGESQKHKACAYCHTGANVPDHYYD